MTPLQEARQRVKEQEQAVAAAEYALGELAAELQQAEADLADLEPLAILGEVTASGLAQLRDGITELRERQRRGTQTLQAQRRALDILREREATAQQEQQDQEATAIFLEGQEKARELVSAAERFIQLAAEVEEYNSRLWVYGRFFGSDARADRERAIMRRGFAADMGVAQTPANYVTGHRFPLTNQLAEWLRSNPIQEMRHGQNQPA